MSRWQESFPWTAAFVRFLFPEGPARRKRWIRFAAAVVAVLAVHAALTLVMTARTQPVFDDFVARFGPMSASAHRPAVVDDASNKARAVRAAAEVMVVPPVKDGGAKPYESFGSWSNEALTAADRDLVRKVVDDNAVALRLLDLAAARPGANWDLHYERGLEMDIPPLLRIMQLAKMNAAAGRLALEEGGVDDALTAVRRGTAIEASLGGEPVLIVQMIRLAVSRIHLRLVEKIIATATLAPAQLAALRSSIPGIDPRDSIRQASIVETKALDEVLRGATVGSIARLRGEGTDGFLGVGVVRAIARPYLLSEEKLWLELMTRRIDALASPLYARRDGGSAPKLRPWNVLVRLLNPEDKGLEERADLAESRERLAGVAIAVERRRLETGTTPRTLADLVPAYLPALPVDPLTGSAFGYETDGTAWRVHSAFDWRSKEYARLHDPVLDWSRGMR